MRNKVIAIVKILILSTALSVFIKYGGQMVAIAPTQIDVLLGVFSPAIVMAILLGWRAKNKTQKQDWESKS
jgi:membrane protein implicated in regulation of membrane protease activity